MMNQALKIENVNYDWAFPEYENKTCKYTNVGVRTKSCS